MIERPESPALRSAVSEAGSMPDPQAAAPQSSRLNFQKAGAIFGHDGGRSLFPDFRPVKFGQGRLS